MSFRFVSSIVTVSDPCSKGVPEPAPFVPLFHLGFFDGLESTVPCVCSCVVHLLDDFVSRAAVPDSVLPTQQDVEQQGAYPADGDVGQYDAVPQSIPWFVDSTVLLDEGVRLVRDSYL